MAASLWMGDVSVRPGPARGVVRRTAGRPGLRAPPGLRALLGSPRREAAAAEGAAEGQPRTRADGTARTG